MIRACCKLRIVSTLHSHQVVTSRLTARGSPLLTVLRQTTATARELKC